MNSQDSTENPAARLHALLSRVEKRWISSSLWAESIGIDPIDRIALRRYTLEAVRLVDNVREAVDRLPPNKNREPLLRHLPDIEEFFGRAYFAGSEKTVQAPAAEAMFGLEMCADALREYDIGDATIPETDRQDLLNLVQELITAVRDDAELDSVARLYLLDRLMDVERALLHFELVGLDGVEAAIDRLVGGTIAYPQSRKQGIMDKIGILWRRIHGFSAEVKSITDAGTSAATFVAALTVGDSGAPPN